MSVTATNDVWQHSTATGAEFVVQLALARHCNEKAGDRTCYPGLTSLAREARVSKDTVRRAIRRLVKLGEVVVVQPGNGRKTATYRLRGYQPATGSNLPPLADRDPRGGTGATPGVARVLPKQEVNRGRTSGRSDPLFDAVMTACGWKAPELTESARGQVNAAVKGLRKVAASPAEVQRRAATYRHRFPSAVLTPTALVKHWPALTPADPYRDRPVEYR